MMIKKVSEEENSLLMQTMRDNVEVQDDPKVGMFWYHPKLGQLIGVKDAYAAELAFNEKGRKTLKSLHAKVWPEISSYALLTGAAKKPTGDIADYTQVPRGRVFQIDTPGRTYFEVLVGSWINDYPEAAGLIIKQFNLNGVDFDFIESEHWDIGRGTSEIFF
ncbi:hypothetical protein FACS1894217_07650 [Clostridia bacterium]|nr:hypothetical protein FACS1894217_07650 [Clostridia bacterium]